MSPRVRFLESGSTYLDNGEQGVFDDLGEVQLEVLSVSSYIHIVLRPCTDIDGLHHSEHSAQQTDPLSLGKLPSDSAS